VSTAALTDRGCDVLPCDRFTVAVFWNNDDYGQHAMGGFEIGIYLDLGCYVVVSKRVYDSIDMRSQTLVVIPRDTTRDRELTLDSPEIAAHIQ